MRFIKIIIIVVWKGKFLLCVDVIIMWYLCCSLLVKIVDCL